MGTKTVSFSRLNGALTILLAFLLLCLGFLPSVLLDGDARILSWVLDPAWAVLSVMAFLATILAPFVMMGLFTHQRHQLGRAGVVGLLLSVAGMLLYVGFQFDLAFVWPVLAQEIPGLLDFDGAMFRAPLYSFVHFWMGPVTTGGVLVFGIATYRARVFPRWSAVLFIIGMILTQGMLFPPLILRLIGSIPAAFALTAMGYKQAKGGGAASPFA
jgi:hypothetical protein